MEDHTRERQYAQSPAIEFPDHKFLYNHFSIIKKQH